VYHTVKVTLYTNGNIYKFNNSRLSDFGSHDFDRMLFCTEKTYRQHDFHRFGSQITYKVLNNLSAAFGIQQSFVAGRKQLTTLDADIAVIL